MSGWGLCEFFTFYTGQRARTSIWDSLDKCILNIGMLLLIKSLAMVTRKSCKAITSVCRHKYTVSK